MPRGGLGRRFARRPSRVQTGCRALARHARTCRAPRCHVGGEADPASLDAAVRSHVDVAAHAGAERRAVHELGGRRVLRDVPHRLVDRDLVGRHAARSRPSSTSPSSVPTDGSRPASSAQPAGGGSNAWQRLDEQPRRRGQRRVELAARRREADRGDVRAGRDATTGRATRTTCRGRSTSAPSTVPAATPSRAAAAGSRATSRTSENSRTSGSIRRCARAWTPEPTTASTRASSRASARTDSADPAAVRSPVIASPSISARHAPRGRVEQADHGGVRLEPQLDVAREHADELHRHRRTRAAARHRQDRAAVRGHRLARRCLDTHRKTAP